MPKAPVQFTKTNVCRLSTLPSNARVQMVAGSGHHLSTYKENVAMAERWSCLHPPLRRNGGCSRIYEHGTV